MKIEDKKLLQETTRESLSIFGYGMVIALVIMAIIRTTLEISIGNIALCIVTILLFCFLSWAMYPIVKDIINSYKKK
jgi:hypothetical protein